MPSPHTDGKWLPWSHHDVEGAFANVRDQASEAHNLLLKASRAVLQYGSQAEASGPGTVFFLWYRVRVRLCKGRTFGHMLRLLHVQVWDVCVSVLFFPSFAGHWSRWLPSVMQ